MGHCIKHSFLKGNPRNCPLLCWIAFTWFHLLQKWRIYFFMQKTKERKDFHLPWWRLCIHSFIHSSSRSFFFLSNSSFYPQRKIDWQKCGTSQVSLNSGFCRRRIESAGPHPHPTPHLTPPSLRVGLWLVKWFGSDWSEKVRVRGESHARVRWQESVY